MKKIILTLFLTISYLFSFNSNIQSSYAIGIFHENGEGENIQHKKISDNDYNGTCFSKIIIFGEFSSNSKIEVKIGNSLGYMQNQIPIYNKNKIKIATEITFIHYNLDKGYFEIKIDNKLYDTKVFIK
jgi:hypothetical protein